MEVRDPNSERISSDSVPLKHPGEDSQKIDSGMDEGSNSSQDIGGNSEDEEVVSHRPKKTVHRILDDESEDSRDVPSVQEPVRSQKKDLKTADEALDEILNASSSDDSSDGENVTLAASLKKKKIVKRQVSDESSDDDQETLSSVIKNRAKSTMNDIFDAEDSDSQGVSQAISQKDSQASVTSQTPGDQADDEGTSNLPETSSKGDKPKKKKKKKKKNKEPSPQKKKAKETGFGTGTDFKSKEFISDSDSDSDIEKPAKTKSSDDDSSSGDSSSGSGSDSDASNKSSRNSGDEGFDESAIDPALLKKLKKGAAKKERPERRSKKAAMEEMMSIHSESQRMVRAKQTGDLPVTTPVQTVNNQESRVSVPYHQPAPRSINDFLARATKKQHEYKVLKGTRDFTKAKLMQDLLQKTKLPAPTLSEPTNDSDEDWAPEDDGMKKLKERLDEKLKGKEIDKEVSGNSDNGSEKYREIRKEDGNRLDDGGDSDNDSLPDIGDGDRPKVDDRLKPQQGDDESLANSVSVSEEQRSENMDTGDNVNKTENVSESKRTESVQTMQVESVNNLQNGTVNSKNKDSDQTSKVNEEIVQSAENIDKNEGANAVPDTRSVDSMSQSNNISQNIETPGLNENDENRDPDTSKNDTCANDQKSPKEKGTQDINVTSAKKKKLAVLASLDLDNVKPCLSGNSDAFVCLVEEEEKPVNPGVAKLMDRLYKHSAKREKKHATDVDISIIQKDKAGIDKEELKLNTFTYHTEEEKENPLMKLETPGAKLTALKEQLQAKMKEKRELARQHRQEVYDLDNEEGGFNAEEEEEAEMSERSDTDVEDADVEEDENEEVLEEEEEGGEDAEDREANPFADEEAEEDGDENEPDNMSDNDEDEMKLKLDTSDESETEDQETLTVAKPVKTYSKKERSFVISDNEETGDTDHVSDEENDRDKPPSTPAFKEPAEKSLDKPFSLFGSKSTSKDSMPDTQLQSGQRNFGLTFPEESQDLYGNSSMPELGPTQYGQTQESQKLNFFLEDSQSNMLDADGYLRVKSTAKKPASRPTGLEEMTETQDQMDDLLGLCSGRFTGIPEPKDKTSRKSLFDEPEVPGTQGNMDELMDLCSGVFAKAPQAEGSQKKGGVKRKVEEDEEDDIEAFSDNEDQLNDKDDFINDDDEEEEDGHDTDVVSDNDDDDERPAKFTGFTEKNKHGKIRSEFVEAEAELSGSEADSDEDLDLLEEEDIMEIEEGDKDKVANNEKLRDEVGRVHLKQLIDEDKRELMRFQEMYLPDGDLHTEGAGRMRRFRWNNNDDNTQQDMFDNDSEGEQVEEETDTDYKWRKERFEREQFIQEQQEKEAEDTENSQFMKFGKIFLKKQCSVDKSMVQEKDKPTANKPLAPPPGKESPSAGFYKLAKQKRGSFLARSKEALAKIAEMTKPVANPSAGAKSSGKFTFAVISPDKENSQQTEKTEKPKRQARTDTSKNKTNSGTKPPAKKQKLDSEDWFTENSIFNHL